MALRHYALVLIHPAEVDELDATGYRLVCKGDGTVIFMLFVPGYDDEDYNMLPGVVTVSRPLTHFILHVITQWTHSRLRYNAIHK